MTNKIETLIDELQGWQPIETAPRDGTIILIATPDSVYRARYAETDCMRGAHWLPLEPSHFICSGGEDGYPKTLNLNNLENETVWLPFPTIKPKLT